MTFRHLLTRSETRPWPSPVPRIILFGIGGLLAGVFLYDLFLELGNSAYPFWASLAESMPGIGLAAGVLALGARVSTGSRDQIYRFETAKGCLLGFLGALGVGLVLLGLRQIRGGAAPMVYTLTSVGTFAGTLVGYYRAQDKRVRRELRSITENVSEGIYRSTAEEGIVFANQAFIDMLGYSGLGELRELNSEALYADPSRRAELIEKEDREGELYQEEVRYRRKDGSTFVGLLSTRQVEVEHGEKTYFDGAIADITERKRAEERLRGRERQIRGLANSIPGVVYQFYARSEGDWGLHFVSDHAEDMLGISADEEGFFERFVEQVPSSHRKALLESVERTIEKETPWQFETPFEKPSGERVWIMGTSTPEKRDEEIVFNGVLLDITDRKQAEQALRERQEKVEALYEVTEKLLRTSSSEEVSTVVHEVFHDVFEYPLAHTALVEGSTIVPKKTTTAAGEDLRMPRAQPRPVDGSTVAARALRAGETVVVEDIDALDNPLDYGDLRSAAGVPIGEYGVVVAGQVEERSFDFFDLHLLEILTSYGAATLGRIEQNSTLREAKKEAEAASRTKSAFLANMSHEIRTPLTSIIGFAEALGTDVAGLDLPEGSPLPDYADLIEEGGKRLLKTLEGVLNLSKLEAGQMELESGPVDLGAQAHRVAEELRPKAEEKGILLEVEVPEVETGDQPTWARADEGGIQIVLQNLISNAIKYTEKGRVEVRTFQENGHATIKVEDTGIGMEPEVAESLFEPFRQASEGMGREYEGTGVGLAVTRKAAEEMGGSVEVDTQKGEGSQFTVRLPKAEDPNVEDSDRDQTADE